MRSRYRLVAVAVAALFGGCTTDAAAPLDARIVRDAPADARVAADSRAPVDRSPPKTGPDLSVSTRLTGPLMWQVNPPKGPFFQDEAAAYCAKLTLAGHTDWRIPTIDELRRLIVGCKGREHGGACKVSDPACLKQTCWTKDTCGHCKEKGGPDRGCYWQVGAWGGSCTDFWFFWTSSKFNGFNTHTWVVRFQGGGRFDDGVVGFNDDLGEGNVRCVRKP